WVCYPNKSEACLTQVVHVHNRVPTERFGPAPCLVAYLAVCVVARFIALSILRSILDALAIYHQLSGYSARQSRTEGNPLPGCREGVWGRMRVPPRLPHGPMKLGAQIVALYTLPPMLLMAVSSSRG